ncbi:MAG: site-2 protease family protein [Ruminococcaceae bacterium]|nr:site-2 protease family protein [Oscillospiraceae bacterium]
MNYLTNLWNALDFASMKEMLLRIVSVLLCLTVHETCHGLAAYVLGDPTAKRQNRLSLNPLHHIDWFGLAMMVMAGFGWAKPVPVNPDYFKNPKRGMAITALAGPLSNFVLAIALLWGTRMVWQYTTADGLLLFLLQTALLSIGLAVFNLIPIPPLDGSKILLSLLPERQYRLVLRYERIGILVLWAVVLTGIGDRVMDVAIYGVFNVFCRIVGI